MMWGFESYAEGLLATATAGAAGDEPPRQLSKTSKNNDLFDAAGKPLPADKIHEVTTWRTHHAFGGRCALVKSAAEGTAATADKADTTKGSAGVASGPSWAEQAQAAYQSWSIAFRLSSTIAAGEKEEEPHILLSVAPAYFPMLSSPTGETLKADAATVASMPAAPSAEEQEAYNHRLLDTPLIWEEAYALSVECTPRGLFLWSDHWELYGKKIADRCLDASPAMAVEATGDSAGLATAAAKNFHGAVRLRFRADGGLAGSGQERADPPTATLGVDLQRSPSSSTTAEGLLWQHVTDVPLPLDDLARRAAFRPHVTLLESGDVAEIIS